MTRKVTLSIILILLILGCYELLFGTQETIRAKVASIEQLEMSSRQLNTAVAQLERMSTTDYEQKKSELKTTIKNYKDAKDEYEELIPDPISDSADAMIGMEENELKDIYDVDFLWTIVGNYATEEGINLKFDINKNTTSASSLNNTSSNYIVCDLKFVITGKYINLTDFIYDIEDDDRLNFEINNFSMQKNGDDLEVTLTVREIKINSDNLIESTSNSMSTQPVTDTQTIDSTTSSQNNTISNNVN